MGTMKMDIFTASKSIHETIDDIYRVAFGPSQALYRQISLCGWRPLDYRPKSSPCSMELKPIHDHEPMPRQSSGIEIYETLDAMTIEVALSCVKEESLYLSISGKTVVIRGERIITAPRGQRNSYPLGRQTRFQHLIPLPETVKTGGFRAQLKGDVVQIDFAKRRMQ